MIVRFAESADATAMAGLLNEIIWIGGSTAYEDAAPPHMRMRSAPRADNAPDLGCYSRPGFRDHDNDFSFTLKEGTVEDRVHLRFDLNPSIV